ncbi:MAG: hypothetical protein ACRED8_11420, partial [Caulobacteraceae bacterium]
MNGVTSYVYDAFGDLLATTGPLGKTISNTYDVRGRKIASSDPDMGSWSYGYDGLDELVSQTDAKGQTTTMAYDLLGRMTSKQAPDLASAWTWDEAAHGVGRLASATTNQSYARLYAYDSLGRPTSVTLTINGNPYGYVTNYLALSGKAFQTTYPSGLVLERDYNSLGYLADLKDLGQGLLVWRANTRDAELHPLSVTLGGAFGVSKTFNVETGRIETVQAGAGAGIANFSYGFDTLGNLISRADANESLSETFGYDALNRLLNVTKNGVQSWSGTYDAEGDILTKSDVGTYSYGSGAGPHAVTSIAGTLNGVANPTFAYDANGAMLSGAGRSFAYDASGHTSFVAETIPSVTEATTLYLNDPTTG